VLNIKLPTAKQGKPFLGRGVRRSRNLVGRAERRDAQISKIFGWD
jgi:hypothetical protein